MQPDFPPNDWHGYRGQVSAIAEVALRHLFRVYPDLYRAAALCHGKNGEAVSEREKRVLRRYGVLEDTSLVLSGQMMVSGFDALSRNQSKEQDQDSSAVEEKVLVVDVGVGEWAEELAALGKRRNLLERKLREVVLNFLRFDAMTNGKLPELLSRIVGVLPEKQRSAMTHMTAEDAIGKFLWTDLVKLIGKEWQLFAKILGDNAQFIKHADVINDRFDAHAKPADSADFAMYRRSLKYIEDRIAKLQ